MIHLDLSSLNLILLFLDQAAILLISMFEMFCAAPMVSFLMANIKSLANVTSVVLFVN